MKKHNRWGSQIKPILLLEKKFLITLFVANTIVRFYHQAKHETKIHIVLTYETMIFVLPKEKPRSTFLCGFFVKSARALLL